MKKSLKKALACLLAVLMVLCSLPFIASAAEQNRKWWEADGIANIQDITPDPAFTGYDYSFGDPCGPENGDDDLRDEFKPVLTITVSEQPAANKYYGKVAYDSATILNPAFLKAGQKIAVTMEMGGVDVMRTLQLLGNFNTEYLKVAKWASTWKEQTSNTGGILVAPNNVCSALSTNQKILNPSTGQISLQIASESVAGGEPLSTYVGPNGRTGNYRGLGLCVLSFEVLQDCDLSQVLTITTDDPSIGKAGFQWNPYEETTLGDQFYQITTNMEGTKYTCAICPIVWDSYSLATTTKYSVAVQSFENGSVQATVNGATETVPASGKIYTDIDENSTVTLVATADAGSTFLGWKANDGTTVSTNPTFEPVVNANVSYTPVFAPIPASNEIVLTFVDAFENIVGVYTITKGDTSFVAPPVPDRAGYTANGWSVTDFASLTENTVVTPKYTKITDTNYTVTVPAGTTITINGVDQEGTTVSVPYNTQVTVTNPTAKSWKINGATVAYGNSYTFYVGANVVLDIDTKDVTEETPVVGSVGIEANGTRVSFLATRKIETKAGCVQVNAGFIYGTTGVTASTELVDVNGTSVKAVYTKTDSEQYSISFTVTPGKTYNGKAFITYKNQTTGEINVAYANLQTYNA